MIRVNQTFFILVISFTHSWGKYCNSLSDYRISQPNLSHSHRIRRYNPASQEFENVDYVKPDLNGNCSTTLSRSLSSEFIAVAVEESPPYLIFKDDTRVTGLYGDVWTTLQEVLGFRTAYKRFYPTTISKTMEFEVLLTMASVKPSADAYHEHSSIIGENFYTLFALLENTYVSDWWYTHIFDVYTWILSIFFIVALSFIMMGIYKMQKVWCREAERNSEFGSSAFNLICVLGATSGQGFQKMPSSWSLRMCAFTALIMGMLISCGFNSILTSYLALPSHNIETESLDNVLKEGTHSLCINKSGPTYDGICETMRRSDALKNMRKSWEDLIRSDCPNIERGLKAKNSVCKPGFVYVLTSDALYKQYQYVQGKCQITKISGSYWFSTRSFLHYRSIRHRDPINIYLLRLRSAGILRYLRLKWLNQDLEDTYFYTVHRVEFVQVQMILISLLIMMIFSLIICVLENIWFELSRQN